MEEISHITNISKENIADGLNIYFVNISTTLANNISYQNVGLNTLSYRKLYAFFLPKST